MGSRDMTEAPKIYAAMSAIMRDVESVSKDQKNVQQGYKFRGVDSVYLALHSVLAKHQVFTVSDILDEKSEERTSKGGSHLIYRILKIKYTFYAVDGSSVATVVIGEGQDSGDKASNKAMSVAHKYALLQAFCIPTEEAKDPEHDSHEVRPKSKGYDPQNREAQDWLIAQMKRRGISDDKWDMVGTALRGRPASDLEQVIALVGL